MRKILSLIISIFIFFGLSNLAMAGKVVDSAWKDVARGKCSDQNEAWWSSAEAIRIAENVLLYQRDNGGWPKNINMHDVLSQDQINKLNADKSSIEGGYCTIDNGAVKYELEYLSSVYKALSSSSTKANIETGFFKGIQYLLDIQFDNGGWPQFFPFRSITSYSNHITYNDNAMINVMEILRHVYQKDSEYSIKGDMEMTTAAKVAFDKGVDCILKTQYNQKGISTVWCAQHNYKTLEPVMARSYELASLSGGESAGIINLLMSIDKPSYEIKQAIYYSVNWYNEVRIKGKRLEGFTNIEGKADKHIVYDNNAPDMWARFYTLENSTPFFCDRDGVMVFSIAEIGHERRNGYSWYGNYGNKVFTSYNTWFKKWGNSEEQETKVTFPNMKTDYLNTDSILVIANANEYAIGSIKNFELFLDNQLIQEFSSTEINTWLKNIEPGNHEIIVQSTDNKGHIAKDTTYFDVSKAYELNVTDATGSGYYSEGSTIDIRATSPPPNYKFSNWTGDTEYIADVNKAYTTVKMPASDLAITAIYVDEKTSINYTELENQQFICFPNPAFSNFSIDLRKLEVSTIDIYNLNAKLVYQTKTNKGINTIFHGLNPGVYFVKVNSKNSNIQIQRLVVK